MKTKQLFKRMLSLALSLLTVLMLSAPIASVVATEDTNLLGDINDDGDIDQYDYILAKRIHFKNFTPNAEQAERGDVDKDGDNDQYDYILIKRHHFGNYIIVQDEPDTGDPIVVENGLYINMPQSGTLKIAQFADVHFGTEGLPYQNDKIARTKKYMQHLVETQAPDLIVCSGDNIMSTGVDGLKDFIAFMDGLKTPWTFIYGNHDAESTAAGFTKKDLSDYLESCDSPYLLYSAGYVEAENNRYGNFSISVLNNSGTKLLGAILLFDAGGYSSANASYDSITKGQIDWYKSEIDKLNKQYNGDKMLPSIVFSHIQLPEFYDAYVAAKNGSGAKFVIEQKLSDADISEIKTGGPTYENTGFYDVLVEEGSTKAYFVGHAHTYNFQVEMNGITLGFGPQTGFSTNFPDNDLPRKSYVYNFKSDFSFTTDVAVEPGDDLGLTYLGTYDGSATYNEADGTYSASLSLNANHHLQFAYKGVRLTKNDITVTGEIAASSSEAAGKKLYFSSNTALMYSGIKARIFTFTFDPATMTLNIASSEIPIDPNAPTSLVASQVNKDAGADAIAIWTEAGTKFHEVTDMETGAESWMGNGWRYYIIVDAEGKIAYAVLWPNKGYGGPNKLGYYCHPSYSDYTKNPAIKLLDGYTDDYSTGGFKYKFFEIVIPEGGFAITSHGTTNADLFEMLSRGTVENTDESNINTRSVYDSSIRLSYDKNTKTISLSVDESDSSDDNAPTSVKASNVNSDAGADAVAVWTQAGTKLYEVTDSSNGTGAWVGNGWRYYVVIDAEGRIAYAVLHPLSGYGGPNGTGYYCNSYYSDYTQNPAINLLDGYANDWATGGFGYKLYEIVVPEGGFAITSHGATNAELYALFSQGTLENTDIANINTRSVYDSNIRVHYDEDTKTISVTTVE